MVDHVIIQHIYKVKGHGNKLFKVDYYCTKGKCVDLVGIGDNLEVIRNVQEKDLIEATIING